MSRSKPRRFLRIMPSHFLFYGLVSLPLRSSLESKKYLFLRIWFEEDGFERLHGEERGMVGIEAFEYVLSVDPSVLTIYP